MGGVSLSELFAKSGGEPILLGDQQVHSIFVGKIWTGDHVRVRRLGVTASPVQALRLKIVGGKLLINKQSLRDIVLWSDTAPEETVLVAENADSGATIKIWNAWRDSQGTMQAWLGDAGMLIDKKGVRGIRLRCSDGLGGVNFDDLVVEIEFDPGSGKPADSKEGLESTAP
jgi:hypothetical protein